MRQPASATEDPQIQEWVDLATAAAGEIADGKIDALAAWIEKQGDLATALERIRDDPEAVLAEIASSDEDELHRQVTLAAMLEGMDREKVRA